MDRAAARLVLVMLAVLGLAQITCAGRAIAAEPWHVPGDFCDEPGTRTKWATSDKARTRARVRAACEALGASPIVCAYDDAVVWRESFGGAASVRHTRGTDADGTPEHGLGPMGLSLRWHSGKWDGDDEDPAFCSPEVSVVVAHEIYWRAVTVYGADSIADIQAIFAGRFVCENVDHFAWLGRLPLLGPVVARWLPGPVKDCRPDPTPEGEQDICERMAARGFNCHARVGASELGRRLSASERRQWAEGLARSNAVAVGR
jgi:hypothetical protein